MCATMCGQIIDGVEMTSLQDKAWERAINKEKPKVANPYEWEEFFKMLQEKKQEKDKK